jgi:hypothetical protein
MRILTEKFLCVIKYFVMLKIYYLLICHASFVSIHTEGAACPSTLFLGQYLKKTISLDL